MKLRGVLVLAAMLPAGCAHVDREAAETRTETEVVEAGRAEMVRAEVRMPAGELRIQGGAEKLMEGEFTFPADWRPEVRYEETGFRGRLNVGLGRGKKVIPAGDMSNVWHLRLRNDVPIDLFVSLGAGVGELDLSGLSLRSLEVGMGAGELNLDLSGEWKRNFAVKVRGGVGEADIRLPREVGVVVVAKGGIGEIHTPGLRKEGGRYVNEAYGESPITIEVDVTGGIGEINLSVGG